MTCLCWASWSCLPSARGVTAVPVARPTVAWHYHVSQQPSRWMMSSHMLVRRFGVGLGIANVVLVFGVDTWLAKSATVFTFQCPLTFTRLRGTPLPLSVM